MARKKRLRIVKSERTDWDIAVVIGVGARRPQDGTEKREDFVSKGLCLICQYLSCLDLDEVILRSSNPSAENHYRQLKSYRSLQHMPVVARRSTVGDAGNVDIVIYGRMQVDVFGIWKNDPSLSSCYITRVGQT